MKWQQVATEYESVSISHDEVRSCYAKYVSAKAIQIKLKIMVLIQISWALDYVWEDDKTVRDLIFETSVYPPSVITSSDIIAIIQ